MIEIVFSQILDKNHLLAPDICISALLARCLGFFSSSLSIRSFSHTTFPLLAWWFRTAEYRDASIGSFAQPLAHSIASLPNSLAPHCSLRSRVPLRSLVFSLSCSRAHGKVSDHIFKSHLQVVLNHSGSSLSRS